MYLFIETICYEKGSFHRIELHNERCNQTRRHFFGDQPSIKLQNHLCIPHNLIDFKVKCTVTYGIDVISIIYSKYEVKPINSLLIINDNHIEYSFKYSDRKDLTLLAENKGQHSDILIVKNGLITDTSYANIIFKHNNNWYSQSKPLLLGTRLQSYFKDKRVIPARLTIKAISHFSEARIINAMISIEDSPVIPIDHIFY